VGPLAAAALLVLLLGARWDLLTQAAPRFLATFARQPAKATWNGGRVDPPRPVPDFALEGTTQPEVHLSDFRGKFVLLSFGFTFCPDVCPLTMFELAKARRELGRHAADVQIAMVSVDPERDTTDRMREWLGRFDPAIVGLRGPLPQIEPIAWSLGIVFQRRPGTIDTGYIVAHTTDTLLLDRQGQVIMEYRYDAPAAMVRDDLNRLLQG
jgi:protein SCO1/2